MNTIKLVPACIKVLTNEQGLASFSFAVPGVFGLNSDGSPSDNPFLGPYSQGRYFDRCEIWAESFEPMDRVYGFCIKDLDGVVPESMRSQFPLYPIISPFYDPALAESATLKQGLYLPPNRPVLITSVGNIPSFIPSGLHICGQFESHTTGKYIFCNFHWGEFIPA